MEKTADATDAKQDYAGVQLTLENCLFPADKLEETPSMKDGMDVRSEEDLRLWGCESLQIAGIMLRVPQVAMATAQVLFQRFYFAKSFVKTRMEEAAMACIWLASKVEEAPRRIRDVINVFHYLKQRKQNSNPAPMQLDHHYITLKNNIIRLERRLLKELGFCVHVKHPHKIIVVYLQVLEMESNQDLVQTAWNYMNDSLRSTVFVRYTPETIACACIYLAARVLKVALPSKPHWFYLFNATEDEIQQICKHLLQVYHHKKNTIEELDAKVEACRKHLQEEKNKLRESNAVTAPGDATAEVSSTEKSKKEPPSEKESKGSASVGENESEKRRERKGERSSAEKHIRSASIPSRSKYDMSSKQRSPGRYSRSRSGKHEDDDLPKSYSTSDENSRTSSKHRRSGKRSEFHHRSESGSSSKKSRQERSLSAEREHKSKSHHKKHGKHKHM
uniref:Cyclin-L1-like n=1 Tax=Phallusia mammillata TaxID=59560 RepID=A0A6F9D9A4_9ASCI|nr:cyclin-L1-like [Phallusia mammillata]